MNSDLSAGKTPFKFGPVADNLQSRVSRSTFCNTNNTLFIRTNMSNKTLSLLLISLQAICIIAAPKSRFLIHTLAAPSPQYLKALTKCGRIVAQNWKSRAQTRIEVKFRYDMKGVYASAYPTSYQTVNGAKYPVAMAKYITRKDYNEKEKGDSHYDMIIQFNMKYDWYAGLDGKPGLGQVDFVSICLHEVVHGLFMSPSGIQISKHEYSYAIGKFSELILHRYSQFLACETPKGDCSLASYRKNWRDSGSPRNFGRCATGNALWFRTGKERIARIYAPNEYARGSSLSHLDEDTYKTANSLLTPFSPKQYVNHEFDPLLLRIMRTMMNQSEPGAPVCNRRTVPYVHTVVMSLLPSPSPSPSPEKLIVVEIRP